jgi:hypothetical protein
LGEDLDSPYVQVISKMRGGFPDQKMQKFILRADGKIWRQGECSIGGELKKDFLLVSRLPRTSFADILICAGAHGAGTEAAALLLRKLDIRQLRELHYMLTGSRYFQFVMEVTKVEHRRDGTMPKAIRINFDDVPPIKLKIPTPKLPIQ